MRIGVLVRNFGGFRETGRSSRACVDLAIDAERLGFDSVWVTDHIVLPRERAALYPHNESGSFPFDWRHDIHDPMVLLGALAQATERVEIGTAVLVIPYRHPLTAAKMLSTVDQLSNGRLILGAGVGWLRDEFDALGLPVEIFEHRGTVTEEYLRIMRAAWTAEETVSHHGRFIQFDDIGARPLPSAPGRPPIWIGGKGERALKRAVALGDGYLAISSDAAMLRSDVARLRELATDAGRDPDGIHVALIDGITLSEAPLGADRAPFAGTCDQILEDLSVFSAAGLDHLVAGVRWTNGASYEQTIGAMEVLAKQVLPECAGLR